MRPDAALWLNTGFELLQQLGTTTGHTVVLGGWPAVGRGEPGRRDNARPEPT